MNEWVVGLLAALGMALITLPASDPAVTRFNPRRLAARLGLAFAVGLVAQWVIGIAVLTMIAFVAVLLVISHLERLRAHKQARLQAQAWPDLLDNLVSALRAGISLAHALVALDETAPEVLRPILHSLAVDIRAQVPLGEAIERWRDTASDPVVDRIAMTLLVAVSIGGRALPTVLTNLSSFLRAEGRTRAELLARQSWTVNAARLAVVAPWLMIIILGARAREAYQTPTGGVILIAGAIASALGYLWMTNVARLPQVNRIFA